MASKVTSPPTLSPTVSQQRVKARAPTSSGPGSSKSVTTSLPNISPTNKSLIGGELREEERGEEEEERRRRDNG